MAEEKVYNLIQIQGDHSACSKPLVDIDLKVHINVNGRF